MSTIIISLLLFIVIAIVYLLKYNKIEHFDIAEKPNTFAQAYLKNMDLDYIAKKLDIPVSIIDLVKSNQIAPIVNPGLGVEEQKDAKVPVVEKTNRIPDKHSDLDNYVVPMPKFKDIGLEQKIKESFTKETPISLSPTKIKVLTEQKNLNTCKFVGSFSAQSKCPKEFPIHTGASISNNKTLSCNGQDIIIKQAKAIALINKGKITSVELLDGGENYTKEPRILVRSNGTVKVDAVLKAIVKNGKVTSISITNPGDGYRDTPKILVEKPSKQVYCNLCCKHEL